ncbi:PAS domain S-box protein [Bordetella sp. FB-8]|uniref:PAS domain-containing sensor histidine kinase n=1 Tax=Bordetella sp. FB-8 TaxID=1159870 RepID=UPI00037AA287|nr:PAS domain S-box protein [Bordetella sp. FB-8]
MENHAVESQTMSWLLTSATEPMLIADGDGRLLLVNGSVERLFGYGCGQLHGASLATLFPGLGSGVHAAAQACGLKELAACRKDCSQFPAQVHFSALQTHWGMPLVLATVRDLTSSKQTQQALLDSEARMRAIVDTAVDAIITIDRHGTIERMNPAAIRMFGYGEHETVGNNVSMLMPTAYRQLHDGFLQRYLTTGEKRIIGIGREVMGQRKDGTCFPMDLAVAEMHIGTTRMFTGMVRDISERKRSEAEVVRLLAELTRANEELTNFAYVVSHDLKAPLRGISALANWIGTDYADPLGDQGRQQLHQLSARVARMGALIDGILEYSRVRSDNEAPERVDMVELTREIIDSLAPADHILIRVDPRLPAVTADRARMHQLFQNLLANAIQHSDKERGEIWVGCSQQDGDPVFSVSDNGMGIEPRHVDRIFQLFQTLASREETTGTGIGLALVKKIVEMYGGRIHVESTPRLGSTFSFTLPRATRGP